MFAFGKPRHLGRLKQKSEVVEYWIVLQPQTTEELRRKQLQHKHKVGMRHPRERSRQHSRTTAERRRHGWSSDCHHFISLISVNQSSIDQSINQSLFESCKSPYTNRHTHRHITCHVKAL